MHLCDASIHLSLRPIAMHHYWLRQMQLSYPYSSNISYKCCWYFNWISFCIVRIEQMACGTEREQKRNITNGLLTSWNEFLIASSICFLSIDWNSNFELKMKWKLNNADVTHTHTRNQFNGIDYCYYCTRLFSLQLKLPAHYHHTGMVFRLTWTCFAYNK